MNFLLQASETSPFTLVFTLKCKVPQQTCIWAFNLTTLVNISDFKTTCIQKLVNTSLYTV